MMSFSYKLLYPLIVIHILQIEYVSGVYLKSDIISTQSSIQYAVAHSEAYSQ